MDSCVHYFFMLISQTAEYALRVTAQLAILDKTDSVSREDLAKLTKIPVHFLAKIMRRLAMSGIVNARRGVNGGFILSRPLNRIRMVEVLRAVGYKFDIDHCAFGWPRCSSVNPCPLHGSWRDVKESFRTWAEKTTLADIKRKQGRFLSRRYL